MIELGRDLDLLEKPFSADDSRQFRPKHLHGNLAVMLEVPGQVHRGHAASTNFLLDGVAVGEGGGEAIEKLWHCVLAPLVTLLEYGLGSYTARQGEDNGDLLSGG